MERNLPALHLDKGKTEEEERERRSKVEQLKRIFIKAATNPVPLCSADSGYSYVTGHRIRRRERVFLNVYNLTEMNRHFNKVGFPILHSAVEVFGIEIAFGGHEGETCGIFESTPYHKLPSDMMPEGLSLRESRCMGSTLLRYSGVQRMIEEIAHDWPGNSYDLLRKNCNHFVETLLYKLLRVAVPKYINRAARVGSACARICPASFTATDWGPEPTHFAGQGRRLGFAVPAHAHAQTFFVPGKNNYADSSSVVVGGVRAAEVEGVEEVEGIVLSERRPGEAQGSARQMAELAAMRRLCGSVPRQMKMSSRPVASRASPRPQSEYGVDVYSDVHDHHHHHHNLHHNYRDSDDGDIPFDAVELDTIGLLGDIGVRLGGDQSHNNGSNNNNTTRGGTTNATTKNNDVIWDDDFEGAGVVLHHHLTGSVGSHYNRLFPSGNDDNSDSSSSSNSNAYRSTLSTSPTTTTTTPATVIRSGTRRSAGGGMYPTSSGGIGFGGLPSLLVRTQGESDAAEWIRAGRSVAAAAQ